MKGVFAWVLGALALLLFVATVVRAGERAKRALGGEPGVLRPFTLLVAAAAIGMLLAAQAGAGATAVVGHHGTDAGLLRALDEIGHMLAHLSVVPLGLLTAAMALTLADARLGPRWLAYLGVAVGALMAVSGIWVVVGGQRLHDAGGLTWLGSLLWWIAQSVTLTLHGRAPRERAAGPTVAAPVAA
jgi:hypothetical protein